MTIEIKVGPSNITISHGRTFMVTDRCGYITTNSEQGLYARDTRFVSFYKIYVNRVPWNLVNSSSLSFYTARFHLTNPPLHTASGIIAARTLELTVNRSVSEDVSEEFTITNYGDTAQFILEVALRSDFADIFEVKTHEIAPRGQQETRWVPRAKELRTTYDHQDYHRIAAYQVTHVNSPAGYANGRIFFQIQLDHNQQWQASGDFLLGYGRRVKKTVPVSSGSAATGAAAAFETSAAAAPLPKTDIAGRRARWRELCTDISTPVMDLYYTYRQAITDMDSLRIFDMDVSDQAWVPAAGVPWFVTLFGRDSLTASYQNMSVSPDFARGALKRLAEYQASERDDRRDAQPGKIMHEIRFGELAHFGDVPFTPYYGTADATILYLIVLSETYRWTGDIGLLKEYRQVAEGCLHWIDHYGDLDGDGFQEYKTFSSQGYNNLSWKDATNAVVYADGSQVKQPKALVELQGYVYDAKIRMAEVFQALDDQTRAQALLREAETLKRNFNQEFWMEDEGCFAFGLDPEKRQITSIASNAGQCLWGGIADQGKAERTGKRLLQEDMWSGWGIRTLSSKNPAYNPLEYQLGSVWPQDNGIIAAGLKRYGMTQEANQVIGGILDATNRFDYHRPPEVFAGIPRSGDVDFPVLYPAGANVPQAWATGSIFHMLRTMLGLRADAPRQRLYVNPTLPDWLPEIEVQRLRVGRCSVALHFWREGDVSRWEATDVTPDTGVGREEIIQVVHESTVGA